MCVCVCMAVCMRECVCVNLFKTWMIYIFRHILLSQYDQSNVFMKKIIRRNK